MGRESGDKQPVLHLVSAVSLSLPVIPARSRDKFGDFGGSFRLSGRRWKPLNCELARTPDYT